MAAHLAAIPLISLFSRLKLPNYWRRSESGWKLFPTKGSAKEMRPAPFQYFAPDSIGEVMALLAEHGEDARLLAGGQSLIPLMNLRMGRPEVLIDLNRCTALTTIERCDGHIVYGAMVRQIDAQQSEVTRECCPLIDKALI